MLIFAQDKYVFLPSAPKVISALPAALGLNDIPLPCLLSALSLWDECVSAVDEVKVVIWLGPVRIMVCLYFLLVFSGGRALLQLYLNVCFVVWPAKLARSKNECKLAVDAMEKACPMILVFLIIV